MVHLYQPRADGRSRVRLSVRAMERNEVQCDQLVDREGQRTLNFDADNISTWERFIVVTRLC